MIEPTIYTRCPRDGYCLAAIPALPGCIASGKTRDEAIANARRAFRAYLELLDARGVSIDHWRGLDPDRFAVEDFPASGLLPGEERGLEEHEIRDFLHVFEAQRAALIALVERLPADELQRKPDESTWSVREALEHIMNTQASLLSRLERWPDDPFNTLQAVHRLVFQRFTVMDPGDTAKTRRFNGFPWTARRVMRRLLEHEWEHYGHISEIIDALGRSPKA
jgi:predicted RNase H-like HicB family nuclease